MHVVTVELVSFVYITVTLESTLPGSKDDLQYFLKYFLQLFFLYNSYINTPQRSAQWAKPQWGAEPSVELGLALQQASALPTVPRCAVVLSVLLVSSLFW